MKISKVIFLLLPMLLLSCETNIESKDIASTKENIESTSILEYTSNEYALKLDLNTLKFELSDENDGNIEGTFEKGLLNSYLLTINEDSCETQFYTYVNEGNKTFKSPIIEKFTNLSLISKYDEHFSFSYGNNIDYSICNYIELYENNIYKRSFYPSLKEKKSDKIIYGFYTLNQDYLFIENDILLISKNYAWSVKSTNSMYINGELVKECYKGYLLLEEPTNFVIASNLYNNVTGYMWYFRKANAFVSSSEGIKEALSKDKLIIELLIDNSNVMQLDFEKEIFEISNDKITILNSNLMINLEN